MIVKSLCDVKNLDIEKTFECGQCFRWNTCGNGVYTGVVNGIAARVWTENGVVYISSSGEYDWINYFDLNKDYREISDTFLINSYMRECVDYGFGIRLLRQESWEALCSFIISQCNNIPRIKGIVEKLCFYFGEKIVFDNNVLYSFPTPERISSLELEDLAVLKCGYRAPYILNAARSICYGNLSLEKLKSIDSKTSYCELLKLEGVGPKVANCVNLFGLYHMDAFPIDVWMKRALSNHFDKEFDPKVFGEYAGLAQQYMFYHARSELNDK